MTKTPNGKKPNDEAPPSMPFDDALRKLLKAPPQHKTATTTKRKDTERKG